MTRKGHTLPKKRVSLTTHKEVAKRAKKTGEDRKTNFKATNKKDKSCLLSPSQ